MNTAKRLTGSANKFSTAHYEPVSVGDVVRYDRFGWEAVVIGVTKTQVRVQSQPGQGSTWYRANVTVI